MIQEMIQIIWTDDSPVNLATLGYTILLLQFALGIAIARSKDDPPGL